MKYLISHIAVLASISSFYALNAQTTAGQTSVTISNST
jgi:hypothetical protein